MTNVRRLAGPLVATAAVLALGACGGGGDDGGDAADTSATVTAFPTIAPPTTTPSITLAAPSTVAPGTGGPTFPSVPSTTVPGQAPTGTAADGDDDDDDGGGGSGSGSDSVAGVYTVVENDWLEKIADKLDVDYQDLLEVNGFSPDSLIVPGQKIKVPGGSGGSDAGDTATTADGDSSSDTSAGGSGDVAGVYTVQANDYLSGIADKLDVDYADLLAVNGFTDSSVIHPGDKIKVPA